MAAMRFAYQHLAKPVMNLFKGANAGDLALRFGPDVAYAAMAGLQFAPPDATLAERAAMTGEDLLYGVGSSLTGQLIGQKVGRGRAAAGLKKAKAKGVPTEQAFQQAANTTNMYTNFGDVLGQLGMSQLPRPVMQGVYEAAGERGNVQAQEIAETQRGMLEEQELALLLGQLAEGGYITINSMRGQTPGTQISARALNA